MPGHLKFTFAGPLLQLVVILWEDEVRFEIKSLRASFSSSKVILSSMIFGLLPALLASLKM